jgi:hypothetical protein
MSGPNFKAITAELNRRARVHRHPIGELQNIRAELHQRRPAGQHIFRYLAPDKKRGAYHWGGQPELALSEPRKHLAQSFFIRSVSGFVHAGRARGMTRAIFKSAWSLRTATKQPGKVGVQALACWRGVGHAEA